MSAAILFKAHYQGVVLIKRNYGSLGSSPLVTAGFRVCAAFSASIDLKAPLGHYNLEVTIIFCYPNIRL